MSIAYVNTNTAGSGTGSATPTYPASIVSGNLLLLTVTNKFPNNAPATPAGWTLLKRQSGGNGSDGTDTGNIYTSVYYRIADGSETGTLSVTVSGGLSIDAQIYQFSKTKNTWQIAGDGGAQNSGNSTSWSVACATDIGLIADDLLVCVSGLNTDNYTYTGQSVSASGISAWGTHTEIRDAGTASGSDSGTYVSSHPVTTGTSAGAATFVMTASGSATNAPAGSTVFIRLREVDLSPINLTVPVLTGTQKSGNSLTASAATWQLSSSTVLGWQTADDSNGSPNVGTIATLSGQTASTLSLGAGHVAKFVRSFETSTNAGGSTTAYSEWTDTIATTGGETFPGDWRGRDQLLPMNPLTTLANPPLFFDLSLASSEFWDRVQSTGRDIRASLDDNTQLPCFLVPDTWDYANRLGVLLTFYPGNKTTSNQKIRVKAGNSAAVRPAIDSTYGQHASFHANQRGAWSLSRLTDMSGGGYDWTAIGAPTLGDQTGGLGNIKATRFNGSTQYLNDPDGALPDVPYFVWAVAKRLSIGTGHGTSGTVRPQSVHAHNDGNVNNLSTADIGEPNIQCSRARNIPLGENGSSDPALWTVGQHHGHFWRFPSDRADRSAYIDFSQTYVISGSGVAGVGAFTGQTIAAGKLGGTTVEGLFHGDITLVFRWYGDIDHRFGTYLNRQMNQGAFWTNEGWTEDGSDGGAAPSGAQVGSYNLSIGFHIGL